MTTASGADATATATAASSDAPLSDAPLSDAERTARDRRPGTVHHVVLFRLRDDAPAGSHAEVERRFRALADTPHPDGSGPYIRSLHAGTQNSPEGIGRGFELGFVLVFSSEGDRDFYVGEPLITDPACFDPEHAAFKEFVGPLLAPGDGGVLVFDFTEEADGGPVQDPDLR
jgi:hypothetical protein